MYVFIDRTLKIFSMAEKTQKRSATISNLVSAICIVNDYNSVFSILRKHSVLASNYLQIWNNYVTI